MPGALMSCIVDNVLVVRKLELGWLCEVDGRPRFIGRLQVVPGARMPPEGQRGSIELIMSAAHDLGLRRARLAV